MKAKDREFLENGVKIRRVALVDGIFRSVPIRSLVGICHYSLHEGYLDAELFKKHDCIAKGCVFFEKLEEYPYWVHQENIERKKLRKAEERRAEALKERERRDALERKMESFREVAQEIADAYDFPIRITKVTLLREVWTNGRRPQCEYLVNYLSGSKENDTRLYFPLALQMRRKFGGKYYLWRNKLPNGEFATFEEWDRLTAERK